MAADTQDWTGSVYVTGGQVDVVITAANVTIPVDASAGGTVNVQFSAAQPVTIDTAGGPVNVNLSSQSGTLNVQFPAAQAVTIDTAGGPVDVNLSSQTGTINVQFPAAQAVTVSSGSINATIQNAQIDTSVVNDILPGNELVYLGTDTITVTNLANGANTGSINAYANFLGLWDGYIVMFESANKYLYSFVQLVAYINGAPNPIGTVPLFVTVNAWNSATVQKSNDNSTYYIPPLLSSAPFMANQAQLALSNNSGGTIASDTITMWAWGIKAQVNIGNPTSTPGNIQAAVGSFDTQSGFNTASSTPVTIVSSGNYLAMLYITFASTSTGASCEVLNGTQTIESGISVNLSQIIRTYTFGDGVANNGITAGNTLGNGQGVTMTGYAILRSATPRQRVATVA